MEEREPRVGTPEREAWQAAKNRQALRILESLRTDAADLGPVDPTPETGTAVSLRYEIGPKTTS